MCPNPLPIVAIVGRPNVGKSTLFNRYAGRRRALVEDTPGLTRDRLAEEVEVAGRRVLVVDTAGLDPEPAAGVDEAVQRQARTAVDQADAILFVVDGRAGLLPQEVEIGRALRRTARPVAVAVNKLDAPALLPRAAEFHALGLEPVRAISAEHGTGAWDLLEELVATLPPAPEEAAGEGGAAAGAEALRVALVGRPNVGKSSLLNRLLGDERVVVSDVPGTTRDAVDIRLESEGRAFVFVDTAGLRRPGRRGRTGEAGSALMAVRALERADVALVLMDGSEGITDQDVRVLALVRERGRSAALLVNKADLVEGREEAERRRLRDEITRRLRPFADVPVLWVSARTGRGVSRILPLAERLGAAAARRVSTADLNRWLRDCVAQHEPAMAQRGPRRRPIKFFYATQASVRPPTFVLFCTEPEAVAPSYRRFLENRLRERFDFAGATLRLRLRKRRSEAG
jgi:GTPase